MTFLIQQTVTYALPLMIVALAGVFSERSGTINLALEGIMIIGAYIGVLFVRGMEGTVWIRLALAEQSYLSFQLLEIAAMLVAACAGAVFSLLLTLAAIRFKSDQTITGTALNLIAPAFTVFGILLLTNQTTLTLQNIDTSAMFILKKSTWGLDRSADMGWLGNLLFNKTYLATYISLILYAILAVLLYKTKFGLRLRACGENPEASDSLGVNVNRMRLAGITISGAVAGMGGFIYALTTAGCTANGDVAGFGFLAMAVMIFGNWNPGTIVWASLIFGFFKCIAACYFTLDLNGDSVYALANLGISANIYRMLPFVVTLIVLAFTSKKSRAPKAAGKPFEYMSDV